MIAARLTSALFLGLSTSLAQQNATGTGVDELQDLEYLTIPAHRWDRRLGSSTPLQGNGVVLADDELLYVTSSDGRLSIIHAPSGQLRQSLQPLPGTPIHCESSAVVGDTFVVYTIQEDASNMSVSPNLTTSSANQVHLDVTSRMVAFNRTTLELAWISQPLDGVFAGKPVISSDNNHIFITRNADDSAYFTILESKGGAILLDESSLDVNLLTNHRYGAVGIATKVSTTPYFGGEAGNTNDIVVWHSGGYEDQGETQLFQFPRTEGRILATTQLGTRTWTVATPPVLENSGGNLYFGTSEGRIRGWEDRKFELTSNYNLLVRSDDPLTWLEMRDDRFFVSTSDSFFYVINRTSTDVLWEFPNETNDTMVANPVVSLDGTTVYIAKGDRLYSRDANTGEDIWESPLSPEDGSDIVANFAVSDLFLYYVGRESNLVTAARIAQPTGPTATPSTTPTVSPTVSAAPSNALPVNFLPSSTPTIVPVMQEVADDSKSLAALPIVLGVSFGLVLVALFIYGARKWIAGREDDGIDTNYDFRQQRVEKPQVRPQAPPIQKPKRYKYDPSSV